MGYSINYAKGNTSYPVLVENDPDYVLISAVYHREKRTIGTLIFKLLDNHPSFSVFEKFKGVVYLDFNGVRLFDARIYNVKKDINNIKTVECEGLLGFLNDSVIAPYTFNRNRLRYHPEQFVYYLPIILQGFIGKSFNLFCNKKHRNCSLVFLFGNNDVGGNVYFGNFTIPK